MLQYGSDLAPLTGKYAAVAARLAPGDRVLDVGCYTGGLARALIARGHTVRGIERDAEAARIAAAVGVDAACGDIEDDAWLQSLRVETDVILFLDVLEHLREPRAVLRGVRPWLSETGRLLITGPNVGYWGIRKMLLMGRWDYADAGIMDRTHLKFFTRETWSALLAESGYRVVHIESLYAILPLQMRFQDVSLLRNVVPTLFGWAVARWPGLFTYMFLIEAEPMRS